MIKSQKGQILVIVFIALGVVLFSVLSIVAGSQIYYQSSSYSIDAEKATALAEAGIDKALASLNKTGGSYNGETETVLGQEGSYSVAITSKDAATKIIEVTGFVPNKEQARAKRIIRTEVLHGLGVSFVYGVQVGEGGLQFGHGNTVNGSVYSNGNITADHDNTINGDAWVSGGSQAQADQQTDCVDSNCSSMIMGKLEGQDGIDVAQSFKPQTGGFLNKVSLKVRKIGQPPDVTVRILGDSSGNPNKNDVLATGTLYSNLVGSDYSFVDITFDASPNLSAGTTYWIMVDTTQNNTNFWNWQNDLAQSYTQGAPKWTVSWNGKNSSWLTINGDLSFKTFMGGIPTYIDGGQTFRITGEAHANTIKNSTISTDAYYQTIINSTAANLFPNSEDPPPKVFPISEANINDWKEYAEDADIISGDVTVCPGTLGPGKYVGNFILSGCQITVKSPVWIVGNMDLNNNNIFTLDSSFGAISGVILIDGQVSLKNNNHFRGTGQGSSLLMLLSTYDSRLDNLAAISIKNNGNSGVFYADKGIIEPGTNNTFKELTGWGIRVLNNSTIDYETGLSSTLFTSGPSGSFSLIKGTYQVK